MALDPSEFSLLTRNAENYYSQTSKKNPAAMPKKKGNLFTNLLPTIGGTGGGIAGGALGGAAAGSVILPGIGTAVGGLLGALVGGAAGGAGGKVLENKLEGNALGDGVAKEGAINGVMSASPLRLLKGAAVAGKAGVSGRGLFGALSDGATSAAGPSLIKKTIANELGSVKGTMANKALGLTKGQKNTILEKTGEKSGDIAVRYGIKSADDIPKVTKPLYQEFDTAIQSIPTKFTMKDVQTAFKSVYGPLLADGAPLGQQAIGKQLKAEADNILSSTKGTMSAADLNTKRQAFDKLAYSLKGTDPSAANVNKQARDVLSKLVNGAAEKAGIKTASGRTIKETGREINKLERLAKASNKNIEGTGGSTLLGGIGTLPGAVLGSTAGPVGAATGIATNMVLNSSAGRQAVAKGTDAVAGKIAKSAAKNPYGVKGISKRVVPVGLLGALSQSSSTADSMLSPTSDSTMNTNSIDPLSASGLTDTNGYTQEQASNDPNAPQLLDPTETETPINNSPFAPENATANIEKILANGGTMKDVTQYVSLVQAMQELQPKSKDSELSAQARTSMAASANGFSTLEGLEGLYSNAGGGQGKLGGAIANLGIKTGTNAKAQSYADLAGSSVSQLAKALNGGGQVSDTDAAVVVKSLPSITDSPEVAAAKFKELKRRLEVARQNTLLYGSGGGEQVTQGVQ